MLRQKTKVNGDEEFDKLELRNRTITETLSSVDDLGQDPKQENINGNTDEECDKENGNEKKEEYDKLELRNREVTETLSPLDNLGQAGQLLRHFLLFLILVKTIKMNQVQRNKSLTHSASEEEMLLRLFLLLMNKMWRKKMTPRKTWNTVQI